MTLSRVLWSALIGSLMLVAGLTGSWASNTSAHLSSHDHQLDVLNAAEARQDQALIDINQRLQDIRQLIENQNAKQSR